jgi:hypothetical protein
VLVALVAHTARDVGWLDSLALRLHAATLPLREAPTGAKQHLIAVVGGLPPQGIAGPWIRPLLTSAHRQDRADRGIGRR